MRGAFLVGPALFALAVTGRPDEAPAQAEAGPPPGALTLADCLERALAGSGQVA